MSSAHTSLDMTSHTTLPSPKCAGKYSGIFDECSYFYRKPIGLSSFLSSFSILIFCFVYYNIVIT